MNKHRIQIDLNTEMRDLLDSLVADTGYGTRTAVLRRALNVYRVLVDEVKSGKRVEVIGRKRSDRQRLLVI